MVSGMLLFYWISCCVQASENEGGWLTDSKWPEGLIK